MQKMAEQFELYSDFCLAYPDAMLYFICCYTILYVILCHCMILCCDTDTVEIHGSEITAKQLVGENHQLFIVIDIQSMFGGSPDVFQLYFI